jgi:hypothetical protein
MGKMDEQDAATRGYVDQVERRYQVFIDFSPQKQKN